MTKKDYVMELVKIIIIPIIVGTVIASWMYSSSDAATMIFFGYLFAGIPSGWKILGKVWKMDLVGFSPVVLAYWVGKLFVSLLIGLIAFPINIIMTIVRLIQAPAH